MSRLDALVARKGSNDKTYFTKIGSAFQNKSGEGYTLILDALPLPDHEGKCRVLLMTPKDFKQSSHDQSKSNGFQAQGLDNDEIPW
jgi:hypothetical protein